MDFSYLLKITVICVVLNIVLHQLFGMFFDDLRNNNQILINGLIAFISALPISIYAYIKRKNEV